MTNDIHKTIAEIKAGLECVTPDLVERAAVTWCSIKERETFPEDIAYFRANWDNFNSFRKLVEREKDICRRHTMRAIIEHLEETEANLSVAVSEVADLAGRVQELQEALGTYENLLRVFYEFGYDRVKCGRALNADNRVGEGDG